jgi:hypothetical protein
VGRKLFLKIVNHILVQLEGFGENINIDERICYVQSLLGSESVRKYYLLGYLFY